MSVEQVRAMVAVTGEMELDDPFHRNGVNVSQRIKPMVEGAHEDVVDVEQDPAVRFVGHRAQKLPFAEARGLEFHVARNVLDQDSTIENFLNLANPPGDVTQSLFGIGKGQEVVQVVAADPGPSQMVRDPGRLEAAYKPAKLDQVLAVERVG